MSINKKLKRNHDMYTGIEVFKDYEFTQCCIYEMAIRSKEFQDRYQEIIEMHNGRKKINSMLLNKELSNYNKSSFKQKDFKLLSALDEVGINNKSIEYLKHYNIIDSKIFDIYNSCIIKKDTSGLSTEAYYTYDFNETYTVKKINLGDGYIVDNEIIIKEDSLFDYKDDGSWLEPSTANSIETIYSKLIENNAINEIQANNKIIPNFSRPRLYIYDHLIRKAEVTMNLSLPKHELIAYITHLKDEITNEPNLILSPIELLSAELSSATYEKKLHKESSRQNFLATALYIYDAFKYGMKQSQIKLEISFYNDNNIDERTIKIYHEIAKTYIDDKKYKELITGVSSIAD